MFQINKRKRGKRVDRGSRSRSRSRSRTPLPTNLAGRSRARRLASTSSVEDDGTPPGPSHVNVSSATRQEVVTPTGRGGANGARPGPSHVNVSSATRQEVVTFTGRGGADGAQPGPSQDIFVFSSETTQKAVTPTSRGGVSAAKGRVARIMSNTSDCDPDSLADEPLLFRPPAAVYKVQSTPGGKHLTLGQLMTLKATPRGTQERYQAVSTEPYLLDDIEERMEALGLDQSEGEDAIVEDEGIRTFLDYRPEHPAAIVPSSSTSGAVDVAPSASRGRVVTVDDSGSEYDSEYNDEFDPDVLANAGGMARGVPDDNELEEDDVPVVNEMERAMDAALDGLIDDSAFVWHEDFGSFRGVPEQFSGPTPGPIKDYDTPCEAFIDIWDRDFIESVVLETNRYARQVIEAKKAAGTLKRSSRLHRWRETDVDEMYRLFAVFILMGIDPRTSQHEFWETTGFLQLALFRKLVSYDRYVLLCKFLHFTDNSDVSQNLPSSDGVAPSGKLRKVAPVLTHLNSKFQNLYNLRREIAIDESLTLFKGRLSWVQAIRSKAACFGIKSYELCESLTGYMYKFEIYTGKSSVRDDIVPVSVDLAGKSTLVVLDLLKGLERRGHLVTMDNFYNSPALARHLKGLGFDCLGTLRPNRKNVPEDVAKVPKNVPKGTIVARHSGDISCIAWKDTKVVTMISTFLNSETYVGRKAGKELIKPIAVRDYNTTMGGVDLKDQKLSMYLLERKRYLKWYVKLFKRLLNVSVHNAFILMTASLKRRNKPYLTHRVFRKQLASSLVSAKTYQISTTKRRR